MSNRILFATDVPFWQASTGAEQRILGIYRCLVRRGKTCAVFYLGELSETDQKLVADRELHVLASDSYHPPEKMLNRIKWYADATINQARTWLSGISASSTAPEGPPSLVLEDFEWPWAVTRLGEVIDSFNPDTIIFEYIKMGYLQKAIPESKRDSITTLVDTHDVLHRRAKQFFANGFPHWLKIDKEQEANVLRQFDGVIAIQEKEAELFREMVGQDAEVITAGHAVEKKSELPTIIKDEAVEKVTVGYIGSKNFSNWQAIREFLNCAWPAVLHRHKGRCELVIAGGICDWFDKDADGNLSVTGELQEGDEKPVAQFNPGAFQSVELLGHVDEVEQFYDQIDVVINPVEFGTGLKIKNAESLRYGKLLITTTNGFDGMPEATRLACMVVEDVNEMGLAINSICNDLSKIRPMQKLALELSQTEFSESQAYQELIRYLDSRQND